MRQNMDIKQARYNLILTLPVWSVPKQLTKSKSCLHVAYGYCDVLLVNSEDVKIDHWCL